MSFKDAVKARLVAAKEAAGRIAKAIVATVAPLIVGFGAKYGFDVDVNDVVIVLTALITGAGVYGKRNT